jgi:hypothetical protein
MANRRGRYGDGTLYQRGRTWWLKYQAGGRWHYESSGSPDKAAAQTLLDATREARERGPGAAAPGPRDLRRGGCGAADALRSDGLAGSGRSRRPA